ncbi:hypothetical protein E2C01_090235 [Portunus trituberculatus]|uniref:Uncharacterized protein n=1 Tax=Portunus trituberculatus TaxID=210409 RepID=A0A5B7JAX7_PORTR|nr:hypothetical protein [Portunus trituberculatus]
MHTRSWTETVTNSLRLFKLITELHPNLIPKHTNQYPKLLSVTLYLLFLIVLAALGHGGSSVSGAWFELRLGTVSCDSKPLERNEVVWCFVWPVKLGGGPFVCFERCFMNH